MKDRILTKYTSSIANQYRDYLELNHAVNELEEFVNFYIENYSMEVIGKRMDEGLVNDNSFWIPLRSTFQAIIMMYARIFDSTPDRRKVKIDEQGFSEQGKKYHIHLLSIRNQFVAHAGYSMYEEIEFSIGFNTDGHLVTPKSPFKVVVFGAGEGDFKTKLIPLLGEVKNKIAKKLIKVERSLMDEIKFMEDNQVTREYIKKKIFTNSEVTQSDIQFCIDQKSLSKNYLWFVSNLNTN